MMLRWLSISAGCLAAVMGTTTLLHAQSSALRSAWEGVYTAAQAERGKTSYSSNCSRCHGEGLEGRDEIAPLKDSHFMSNWEGQSLADLVQRVRSTMPLDRPGTLSSASATDIVAYLMQQNGLPAGNTELPSDSGAGSDIRIDSLAPPGVTAPAAPSAAAPAPALGSLAPVNSLPNPYGRVDNFLKLPAGRHMGSTSTVAGDSHGNIWLAERCGENDCNGSPLDPVLEFDAKGNFIKSFGAGQILFPHGIWIDKNDHIWIADNHNNGKIGDDVLEFDQNGRILKTLGKPGVAGSDAQTFHEPNAVLIAPNGDIFVSDGHGGDTITTAAHSPTMGNARVVKLDPDGKLLMQWGSHGSGPGEFQTPHCLAMDSAGRLFVGDRSNNRIQIFDQNGKFIAAWSQFSRPSGCYIDKNDVLYVSDSESRDRPGYAYHPGWKRGVRIGSAKTGVVTAFIPDEIDDPAVGASGGEGVWADSSGAIYNAEVYQKAVVRYVPK
jgi:streptogramin lyase/mono/diheme cytochrome c family protein